MAQVCRGRGCQDTFTHTGLFDFLKGGSGSAPSASAVEAVEELLALCKGTDGGATGTVALREQIEEQVSACPFTGGSIYVISFTLCQQHSDIQCGML